MEAQLNQASTFAAQNYADSFFRQLPTDSRFLQVSFQKFPPSTTLDCETITFSLNRFEAANVYQIQNTHIEIQIVIQQTKDNALPAKTVTVGPINNVVHSFFESVSLKVNDQLITKSASSYPYKAYITNCLTYPNTVKAAQLQTEGYYADYAPHMGPTTNNVGFGARSQLFRKENKTGNDYKSEGARFFGKLQLELMGCQSGLVPGTKVEIEVIHLLFLSEKSKNSISFFSGPCYLLNAPSICIFYQ